MGPKILIAFDFIFKTYICHDCRRNIPWFQIIIPPKQTFPYRVKWISLSIFLWLIFVHNFHDQKKTAISLFLSLLIEEILFYALIAQTHSSGAIQVCPALRNLAQTSAVIPVFKFALSVKKAGLYHQVQASQESGFQQQLWYTIFPTVVLPVKNIFIKFQF